MRMQTAKSLCRLMMAMAIGFLTALCLHTNGALAHETEEPIHTHPPLLSACEYDYPPFCFVGHNEKAAGFSVELLQAALEAMGQRADFRIGTWNAIKDELAQGKLDVLPLVGRTPEREDIFDFTVPYLTLHGTIVVREDNTDIINLASLKGKDVCVLRGDNAEEFMRRKETGATLFLSDSFEDALIQLAKGKYDAVVIQRLLALRLIRDAHIEGLKVLNKPLMEFRQDFCFAVTEGNKKLLSQLNEGLALVIADGTYRQLYTHWVASIDATQQTRSRIIVGGDKDLPPYEYLDKNGQPTGYNVELTKAIADRMGLNVEIRLDTWSEIRRGLQTGTIDAIQGMFYSIERDKTFDFTPPHTMVHQVIVSRDENHTHIHDLSDLRDHKVIVVRGDIMHDFAIRNGLTNLLLADTQTEALKAVAEKKADCSMMAELPAVYLIRKNGFDNLHTESNPLMSMEYCFAVQNNDRDLLSKFTEGLAALNKTGEYRNIHNKWLGPYQNHTPVWQDYLGYVLMAAGPLAALLLLSFLWMWTLRRQVHNRTQQLAQSQTKYKGLFESQKKLFQSMIDGFAIHEMIYDENGNPIDYRFLEVNPAFETLTGLKGTDVIGKTALQMFPELEPIWLMRYGDVAKNGQPCRFTEYSAPLKRYFEVSAFCPKSGQFACVFSDITENKMLQDQLRQAEKMQAIGQLAGGIAHDFNNQLAAIIGYGDMLQVRLADKDLKEFASNLVLAAERASDLTRQLLAFSRKGKYLSKEVDLHNLIEEVITLLNHSMDKRIQIIKKLRSENPNTTGDPSQLQNMLLNIAINARDAMPDGGMLTFETDLVVLDNEFCQEHSEDLVCGQYMQITIRDTGCGMDSYTRQHIFEPFFTTKNVGEGTGMGLASAYGAVKSHGGTILVDSHKNEGSTFRVILPSRPSSMADSPSPERTIRKNVPAEHGTGLILVADDEYLVLKLGCDMLKDLGYTVMTANNGREAVEIYKDHWREIDLVILDMVMPEMNGRDAFNAIRRIHPEAKIMFSSGYNFNGESQTFYNEGVVAFIHKPFLQSELAQIVASALKNLPASN